MGYTCLEVGSLIAAQMQSSKGDVHARATLVAARLMVSLDITKLFRGFSLDDKYESSYLVFFAPEAFEVAPAYFVHSICVVRK